MEKSHGRLFRVRPSTAIVRTIESAIQELKTAAFRSSDISILAPENLGDIRDIATVKSTKAPEGATAGGSVGAIVGAVIGGLLGSGTLPGHGALLAAGPVIAALAGLGVGAVLGALIGAIVGFGKPEFEAKRYGARLKNGGILLSVHAGQSRMDLESKSDSREDRRQKNIVCQ